MERESDLPRIIQSIKEQRGEQSLWILWTSHSRPSAF